MKGTAKGLMVPKGIKTKVVKKNPLEMSFLQSINSYVIKLAAIVEPSIKEEQANINELNLKIEELKEIIKKREIEINSQDVDDRYNRSLMLISKDLEKVVDKYQLKVGQNG